MIPAIEVTAFQADGTARPRAVKLPADPFDGRVHEPALHQAVKVFLANQRQGNAATKTRGKVSGGNQKPWRQKGTGRARQGSIRAPNWPGGGTAFGPQAGREYRLDMPVKLRRLARSSALNARAREQSLTVIAPLAFEEPKTKRMVALLGKMGLEGHKVLLLTSELKANVLLSARNIPDVAVMRYQDASTYDILKADTVVVEESALGTAGLESGAEVTHVAAPKAKKKRGVEGSGDRGVEKAGAPGKRKPVKAKAAPKKAAAKRPAAKKASKPKASARKPAKKPGKKKD